MNFLTGERQKKYSIERLRCLYGDLLRCIDYENHDVLLGLRHREVETSPRYGLVRKVFLFKTKDENVTSDEVDEQRRRDVASAFLALAATRSVVRVNHEVAVRDEATVDALEMAKSLEKTVVSLIRSIGEVVVNAAEGQQQHTQPNQSLRSDEAFEYFCEKAILALFVEIACATPGRDEAHSTFHGVVWIPQVKAQVYHTISLLIAGVRDSSALYYLLSQNCINQLVAGMLPLQQWTGQALETMLPPYVDLLKTLAMQLGDAPQLFPFFTIQEKNRIHFPLFSATLQTGTSAFAQSNSFVHATCLNLIVDFMQIPCSPIQDWISQGQPEQRAFADHLCSLLLRRYTRIAHLTSGPVVDGIRSSALVGQLKGLNDQMELLNDVFGCPLRGLHVRLCEQLLRQVISKLWKPFQSSQRPFLSAVGVADVDSIPASEAEAQAATAVLSRFLAIVRYPPALRMLAVTLWHEKASPVWVQPESIESDKDGYACTKALHLVVEGNPKDLVENVFRLEFYKALRGDYGAWRVVSSASLMYQCLHSIDTETLILLDILPKRDQEQGTPVEEAVAAFLLLKHARESNVSNWALECVASLVVAWTHRAIRTDLYSTEKLRKSPMMAAIQRARDYFYQCLIDSERTVGVSDLFVDVLESSVASMYKKITLMVNGVRTGPRILGYNVAQVGCARHATDAEVLVRKLRCIKTNEIETTRFYAHMALHLRAIMRILDDYLTRISRSKQKNVRDLEPDMIDRADDLKTIFGSLRDSPQVGSDIDIRGRMWFPFFVDNSMQKEQARESQSEARDRAFSDDMIFRPTSTLVAVLDPTFLFVVKPLDKQETARGTVICCVPLLNAIAAASDGDWLHIAVRHDDVGLLIKNGNMALRFENTGTSLIVRQYIDRSRQVLRGELMRKIKVLFDVGVRKEQPLADKKQPSAERNEQTKNLVERNDKATLVEDKKEETCP